MKIGIIGAGNIGGTLASLWVKAGHEVMLSGSSVTRARHVAANLGPQAFAGSPLEAATFGKVVLLAVPFGAVPSLGAELSHAVAGKVLMDSCNPFPMRDGAVVEAVNRLGLGSGGYTAQTFSSSHLVKAFNTLHSATLASDTLRSEGRWSVPIAGNHGPALEQAAQLVRDAGFDPVIVGPIERSRDFDPGTTAFNRPQTAAGMRALLQRD